MCVWKDDLKEARRLCKMATEKEELESSDCRNRTRKSNQQMSKPILQEESSSSSDDEVEQDEEDEDDISNFIPSLPILTSKCLCPLTKFKSST